jgi:hypothetical protein
MDLSSARDHVLFEIFSHLTARDAWNARLVSRGWNDTSERSFQERCRAKRWKLPRRPRGGDKSTRFPFRRLYRANACARCVDGPGAFRVSKDIGRQHIRQFSLCCACVQDPGTVERLRDWSLLVDFQSVEGKVLPNLALKKGPKPRAPPAKPSTWAYGDSRENHPWIPDTYPPTRTMWRRARTRTL